MRGGGAGALALAGRFAAISLHPPDALRCGQLLDQRMLRRQGEERGAEDRVRSGAEYLDLVLAADQLEVDLRSHRLADPIALHFQRGLRPVQVVQTVEQALSVIGDLQHPLPQRPTLARKTADFGAPFHHFLVGQRGPEFRAPPDRLLCLVCEAPFMKLQEYPLRPAIIVRIGGTELARPVVREPQRFQLRAEPVDVAARRDPWMRVGANGVLLGRKPEGVPADRVQDVVAAHALEARDDVGRGVTLRVAHMQSGAAGIGKHVEDIGLGPRLVGPGRRPEGSFTLPARLPLGFDLGERVRRHGGELYGRATRAAPREPAPIRR